MKIKAIKTYSDRETGELVNAGDIKEYSSIRADELIKKGVAIKAKENPVKNENKAE